MSSFTTPLIVQPLPDGKRWKLIEPFRYRIGNRYSDNIITIPKEFITDFASIPRIFWTIIPPWGKYGKAAVLHDFLYYYNNEYSKEKADKIFLEAMKALRIPKWKRKVMYYAVKYFGHRAWKKHRQKKLMNCGS